MLFVTEMVAHLGIHGALDQRFRQLLEQAVWAHNLFGRFACQQLIQCSFELRPVFHALS